MVKYIIIHNKHEGCYDFRCYQDEVARIRATSITINPPKLFMFDSREEAQDFFEEYINDVDCIDIKCKKGDEVEHVDYCTCGIIELDERGEPILFYNKKNQIFLMEHGPQLFLPNQELKNDIRNLNLTNNLIRKCKTLGREQRKRYIELGKYCEECNAEESSDNEKEDVDEKQENNVKEETDEKQETENIVLKENNEIKLEETTPEKDTKSEKKKKTVKKSSTKEKEIKETDEEKCESNQPEKKKRVYKKSKDSNEKK
jgi:hypothetical protein